MFQTVPSVLRSIPSWLLWRFEPGGSKPRKMPYYADGSRRRGKQGEAADRARLVSFDEALAVFEAGGYDGLGLAMLPDNGIVALDFDGCVTNGRVRDEVQSLAALSYAEFSPSKQGVRMFFTGSLGGLNDRKALGHGLDVEVFHGKGFVTVTGDVLPVCGLLGTDDVVVQADASVTDLIAPMFARQGPALPVDDCALARVSPAVGLDAVQLRSILAALDPDMSYPDWVRVGMALHHEAGDDGFELWHDWSATGAKFAGVDNLQQHWRSFGRQPSAPVTARWLMMLAKSEGVRLDAYASVADFEESVAAADVVQGIADAGADFETVDEKADVVQGIAEADSEGVTGNSRDRAVRFEVVDAAEFADGAPTPWLIKGVLPKADLGVIYGESGSGKSFFTADMAFALARGVEWRGRKTRKCRVVYVAAEGGGGFRKRLKAYALHHGIELDEIDLGVIHAAPDFLSRPDVLAVARAIRAWGGADLVILDTFAQVLPGANENAGEDVGLALKHCRGLNQVLRCMVLLVHHSGKDGSKGARGWSGLRAAADFEMEIARTEDVRVARITKQKDGDDYAQWGFDLQVVPVGVDEDGDVVDSCVVVDAAVPVKLPKEKPVFTGRREQLLLEVVHEFATAQSAGIEVDAVLEECIRRSPPPEDGKKDYRPYNFKNSLKRMLEHEDCPFFEVDGCLELY